MGRSCWVVLSVLAAVSATSACSRATVQEGRAPARAEAPAVSVAHPSPEVSAPGARFADGRARKVPGASGDDGRATAEEEAVPRSVSLPEGVTCSVRGGGSPFPEHCSPPSVSAFGGRRGGRAIASLGYQEVDIVWGFFEGAGRAFVDARSGGVQLRGYTDGSRVRFQLARDVEILAGHVWLEENAPIRVAGGLKEGVHVDVDDDVRGVDEIFAPVECRDVRFDPEPPRLPLVRAASTRRTPPRAFVATKHDTLHLFASPGGLPIATLRGSEEKRVPPFLEVVDTSGKFTRVAFATTHARFDVWVANTQITDEMGGIGTSGGGGCGRSRDFISARRPKVLADTHVRVGAYPLGDDEEALTIARGTRVMVQERRDGFAAVHVRSEIAPPEGQRFWIPEDVVSEPLPED